MGFLRADLNEIDSGYGKPIVCLKDIFEIKRQLDMCNDFESFFVKTSELKVSLDLEGLKVLKDLMRCYYSKFGVTPMVYLRDCIQADMCLPINRPLREYSEAEMRKEIVENFSKIFPELHFICTEKEVDGVGRIDVFAEDATLRPVIIELKSRNKNPNKQLLGYGATFENPVLIGITEWEFEESKKIAGIEYYSFREIQKKIRS